MSAPALFDCPDASLLEGGARRQFCGIRLAEDI
jgi:hypothetical protein